jgi:hypothetical protein
MNKQRSVMPYSEVPNKCIFRALLPETPRYSKKKVLNDGVYFKMANSHSLHMASHRDAIFALHMPCRVIHREWRVSDSAQRSTNAV